jgi:DNA topoisomerase-2
MAKKSIEQQFRKLDDIEHALIRSSRYIGSVKPITLSKFIYDNEVKKMVLTENVEYIAGLLKLFDEIIINSVDESKRDGSKLNVIKVNINKDGYISVYDNGGIPVVLHKEEKQYIPELIFSNLKAGSNFNDDEDRTGAGTHGEGSTLVNIFSKEFIVETCDGKKYFKQVFSNNMYNKTKPVIKTSTKNHTQVTFLPDYARFGQELIDGNFYLSDNLFKIFEKRVYDIAGTNPKLKVYFNDVLITIKTFKDYVSLYTDDFIYEENPLVKIGISKSNGSFQQVSFVNSTETSDGGKHVDYVLDQIVVEIRKELDKKFKKNGLKPQDIKNHIFLFLDSTIINPAFTSQTKEKLDTDVKDFGFTYKPSDKFIKAIMKSEIVASIIDWLDKKRLAELNKQERELNKSLTKVKVDKLIDAQGKDRSKCSIGIFEGLSASSAFRTHRDVDTQGCYSLKGKLTNVLKLSREKIAQAKDPSVKELLDLMSASGLKLGQKATKENLRYHKFIIYCDADFDGDHISGLIILFFYTYWKELFDMGMIYKAETPIIVAKRYDKNKIVESINFYSQEEYKEWETTNSSKLKNYDISYKKGLSSLEDDEYREIIKNPRLIQLFIDEEADKSIKKWFGNDDENVQERKNALLG